MLRVHAEEREVLGRPRANSLKEREKTDGDYESGQIDHRAGARSSSCQLQRRKLSSVDGWQEIAQLARATHNAHRRREQRRSHPKTP
jgi:hypothetical protein